MPTQTGESTLRVKEECGRRIATMLQTVIIADLEWTTIETFRSNGVDVLLQMNQDALPVMTVAL
jgi:hypothetical protein